MKRKTIEVDRMLTLVDTFLRNTDSLTLSDIFPKEDKPDYQMTATEWVAYRRGICFMMETILHETGNYKGYNYVTDYKIDESSRSYN